MEPNALLINLLNWGGAFAAYFLGIVIRKVALPTRNSPSLPSQLLLGIPISLVIIPTLITVLDGRFDMKVFIVTIGIIMEHGMIVTESAAKHLQMLRARA